MLDTEKTWEDRAKRYLKVELRRADMGYRELAERLKDQNMIETEASIANKLSRGTFSAAFFLAVCAAIGLSAVDLKGI